MVENFGSQDKQYLLKNSVKHGLVETTILQQMPLGEFFVFGSARWLHESSVTFSLFSSFMESVC